MATQRAPEARDPGPSAFRDEAASWLDEHGDALYRYARARVGRRELAEDLVQDTFVAALQSRGRYRGELLGADLAAVDPQAQDRRPLSAAGRVGAPGEFAADGPRPDPRRILRAGRPVEEPPASWRTPDEALEQSRVLGGPRRLPRPAPALASVFFLRELEGLGMEDLRRALGLSDANIRVRLHRARLLLRECLERRWFSVTLKPPGRPT